MEYAYLFDDDGTQVGIIVAGCSSFNLMLVHIHLRIFSTFHPTVRVCVCVFVQSYCCICSEGENVFMCDADNCAK